MVFTARDDLLVRWIASPELLDVGLLITLATNGFAPTVLTLALITRYGRQSWYLISLSSIVFISSTGMLAASYNAWYATPFDPAYGVLQACGDFLASNLTTTWCGSNSPSRTYRSVDDRYRMTFCLPGKHYVEVGIIKRNGKCLNVSKCCFEASGYNWSHMQNVYHLTGNRTYLTKSCSH